MSLASAAADLSITGSEAGMPLVTIEGARLKKAPQLYGFENSRHGELEFVATRATPSAALITLASVAE